MSYSVKYQKYLETCIIYVGNWEPTAECNTSSPTENIQVEHWRPWNADGVHIQWRSGDTNIWNDNPAFHWVLPPISDDTAKSEGTLWQWLQEDRLPSSSWQWVQSHLAGVRHLDQVSMENAWWLLSKASILTSWKQAVNTCNWMVP